jgi:UDP-N-acetylmuramate dehydrogenase
MIREHVRLAPYTTLQIGGPARFFAQVFSEEDLVEALDWAERRSLPLFILGGGSNVLVADEGFPGLVVHMAMRGLSFSDASGAALVTAGAGEDWDELVRACVERGLAGLECLSGIPGLVGGTPVQNVGAYGQEVSETILTVRAYDRRAHCVVTLANTDCRFSYRRSIFNSTEQDRYVVLAVTYTLAPHGQPTLRYPDVRDFFAHHHGSPSLKNVRDAVRAIRARKGMLLMPGDPDCRSAGSFFKNPVVTAKEFAQIEAAAQVPGLARGEQVVPRFAAQDGLVKVPAAWLIERAGFQKGYRKGRAGISAKHTLAIINYGGATAGEVLELMREIQAHVQKRFGVTLVPEPVFVG